MPFGDSEWIAARERHARRMAWVGAAQLLALAALIGVHIYNAFFRG